MPVFAERASSSHSLLDYLNTSGRFFTVSTDTETRYVNRSHVSIVRPFD